ncbi:Mpped1, partial [Symbiodinium pilosum]
EKGEWKSDLLARDELPPKKPGTVRLVLVSDTHERHAGIRLPACDAVLHSGDILASSRWAPQVHAEDVLKDFGDWLRATKCSSRFVIAGNHDYWIEHLGHEAVQELLGDGVQYLEFSSGSFRARLDPSSSSEVEVSVFGAPVSAGKSPNRAFQHTDAVEQLKSTSPDKSDILMTHGPLLSGSKKGLREIGAVLQRMQPSLHVCGHVHWRWGTIVPMSDYVSAPGVSINASIMRSVGKIQGQRPLNAPIVCDLPLHGKLPVAPANDTCS